MSEQVWDAVAGGVPLQLRPQLSLRLFSPGSGVSVSPRGIDLGDTSVALGADSALRLAASLDTPREWPLPPGEPPFRLRARARPTPLPLPGAAPPDLLP